jgi:hypothetical protein
MLHLHPRVGPAVVARSREEREAIERARALRRWPLYGAVAAGLHAALLLWWWSHWEPPAAARPPAIVAASLDEDEAPLEEPPQDTPLDEALEEPDPVADPPTMEDTQVEDSTPTIDDVFEPGQNVLGLGGGGAGGGQGGGRHSALSSGEIPLVVVGSGGSDFKGFVDDLRERGLDLAFVVDATASMDKFIEQARTAIDGIIADVSAVVPDLRMGVVAYRDRMDSWLTRQVPLTDDRYRIHNFLADLQAAGGGDFEEAVDEGLRVAIEELAWREGSRRVLVLVGDAPPHDADEQGTLSLVRGFARDKHSVLDVLYTGARPGAEPTDRDRNAQKVFDRLARSANGHVTNLQAGEDDLRALILDASFGVEWREDIRALLEKPRADWRQRIVADKVAHGQRAWLIENLSREPVHPAVVEGCVQLFDAEIAEAALKLVLDESRPLPVRSVALYLLKRKVAAHVGFDVSLPLAQQSAQVAGLQRAVATKARDTPGTPPPPLPGGSAPAAPPGGAPPGTPPGAPPSPPPETPRSGVARCFEAAGCFRADG